MAHEMVHDDVITHRRKDRSMSQRTHTCPSYNRLTPIAPYPAHAVELNDWEVADLLATMRARFLHMTDAEAWDDPQLVNIAGHMAAGVKLCLDDLEWACQLAQRAAIERDRAARESARG